MTKMTECCIFLTAQKLQISIHLNNKVVSVKKKKSSILCIHSILA